MLYWALIFLVVALIAAVFGFGGIAAGAVQIARILFFIFLILFVISLIVGGVRHDKQDYFRRLTELVAELELHDIVHFITEGCSSMSTVYAASDLVVSCSKKPESFGRTAAEALAMNIPVVATNHGGVLDIVCPGVTGFLFNPQDITTLVKNLNLCASLPRHNYRSIVEARFSLPQMVDATHNVYQELLSVLNSQVNI